MVRIREITDQDVHAVIALWRDCGLIRPWNDPVRDIAFARRGDHSTILIAEIEKSVAASAMAGHDGHRGWIYYVASAPEHRGKGLGAAIMNAAEGWLRGQGVWKTHLLVRGDNKAVIGFYERLGYRDPSVVCLQKVLEP
jgi:ribosomal protein S18 acetylase RimI-like enzyme